MRIIIVILVILCLIYFLVGFLLTHFKIMTNNFYKNLAAIVGSIASVLGLLSLAISRINKKDLDKIGFKTFNEIQRIDSELKKKEIALNYTQDEIKKLELQKEQLELLVKKVSVIMFTKEQLKINNDRIERIITENKLLYKSLNEIKELIKKLKLFEEEISLNENLQILLERLEAVKNRKYPINIKDAFNNLPLYLGDIISKILIR